MKTGFYPPLRCFAIGMFACLFSTLAVGQIVNVENSRLDEDSLGLQGALDLTFSTFKTTSTLFQVNNTTQLQYRTGDDIWLVLNNLDYLIQEGEQEFERALFQHLRYNRVMGDVVTWEAFVQHQNDLVLRIEHRWLIGTGPRFTLLDKENSRIRVGPLYMFEYEEEEGHNRYHRDSRLSAYTSTLFKFGETVSMAQTLYYQPRFDRIEDYRLAYQFLFSFLISDRLKFNVEGFLNYDAFPVDDPNIPNLTYKIGNGFAFQF